MASNGSASASSWIKLIDAKLPKLTRRQSLTLLFALVAGVGVLAYLKLAAAEKPMPKPPNEGRVEIGSFRIGSDNQGPVTIKDVVVHHNHFEPPKYRLRHFVQSDGRDYPILMADRLWESNLVQAPRMILDVFRGANTDPEEAKRKMFGDKIALVTGTEVEILEPNLKQELEETPPAYKSAAGLLASYHTKVRVLDGKFKGRTGWVVSKLINQERVLVTEN